MYYQINKEHVKEYQERNKRRIQESKKDYYEENKEKRQQYYQKIKHHITRKIKCLSCDTEVQARSLNIHLQSIKHKSKLSKEDVI